MQFLDLPGEDRTATAAKQAYMAAAVLVQQVLHVFEEFQVAALVRGDGNALYVFFDSAFDDLGYRPVMPQVNDFRPLRLQDPPHDIDRRIVPVKKGCGRDEAYFVNRGIAHNVNVWQTGKFKLKN